jgi:hypothetical protein
MTIVGLSRHIHIDQKPSELATVFRAFNARLLRDSFWCSLTTKNIFGTTAQPCAIEDTRLQAEYEHLSDECQSVGHSLNLLHFMQHRLRILMASFQQTARRLQVLLVSLVCFILIS